MFNWFKYRYQMIKRMLYYGWHSRHVVEFDASSIDTLTYHLIKRINKFMKSNKTHLEWNDVNNGKLMRKLSEFEELCKRKNDNNFEDLYYFGKVLDTYGEDRWSRVLKRTKEENSIVKKALAKDRKITKSLNDRYHYMYKHYLPMFWDYIMTKMYGYMCKTDFNYELGEALGGTEIYCSIEDIKRCRPCAEQCGIVKVEIKIVEGDEDD